MQDDIVPKSILEEELLTRLLHTFITKLEASRSRLSIKVSSGTTPELFKFNLYDVKYLWMLIESLETEYQILHIKLGKQHSTKEIYDGATLFFNRDKEALVRHWLKRPVLISDTQRWQQALLDSANRFTAQQISILSENRIQHHNKTATEILDALVCVKDELHTTTFPLSCRTLSARCFEGDSKCLERREPILRQLFPENKQKIKSRPILLSISIPAEIKNVLFIENQETFLDCVAQYNSPLLANTALVYSAGFRGAAERVRNKGGVEFGFVVGAGAATENSGARECFEQWWHDDGQTWPCYFWGDLDYSGMVILASLRRVFLGLQAWQPGYKALLEYHQKGVGHSLKDAKKEAQTLPTATGCSYADDTLLPLLRRSQRCVDQEAVTFNNIIIS